MEYPEKTRNDKILDGVHVGAQLIPFAGGAISEFIKSFVPAGFESRRDEWLKSIASTLDNLPKQTAELFCKFLESEEGKTLLIRASLSAVSTHKHEKHSAIRDVLLGTSIDDTMHYDKKEMYLSVASELEPYDFCVLNIFKRDFDSLSKIESYEDIFKICTQNGFSGTRDELVIVLNRLISKSLVRISDRVDNFQDVYNVDIIVADGGSDKPRIIVTEFAVQLMSYITNKNA